MKVLITALLMVTTHVFAADPQSFDLLLTGKTVTGPHPNEDLATRQLVARTIQNLKVKKYILLEKPANGGFHVCLEPSDDGGYNFILGELNAIAVRQSIWQITLVEGCP